MEKYIENTGSGNKKTADEIIEFSDDSKNIRTIAGPGAGKTETLVRRVKRLILEGKAEPSEIVVFTFTNNAAESMKSRLYKRIAELNDSKLLNSLGSMFIGTIHSFCLKILQDHYDYNHYSMLDEVAQIVYVMKYAEELNLNYENPEFKRYYGVDIAQEKRIKKYISSYNIIYDELLKIKTVEISKQHFINSIRELESRFEDDCVLTFGQLIKLAIENLDHPTNQTDRLGPVKNIKYLFVDEYQDINKAQEKLIKLLGESVDRPDCNFKKDTQVFIVGDPKQSIYNWRGSDILCFKNFYKQFPEKTTKTFEIQENWRSLNNIVSVANRFSNLFDINDSELVSIAQRKEWDGLAAIIGFTDAETEAEWIVNQIKSLVDNGICEFRDIAVLFRSVKNTAKPVIDRCVANGIPYIIGGKVGLFQRKEVQALSKFFAWLHKDGSWGKTEAEKIRGEDLLVSGLDDWIAATQECRFNHGLNRSQLEKILREWKKFWTDYLREVRSKVEMAKNNFDKIVNSSADISGEILDNLIKLDKSEGDLSSLDDITSPANPSSRLIEVSGQPIGSSDEITIDPQISAMLDNENYFKSITFVEIMYDLLNRFGMKQLNSADRLHNAFHANIGRFGDLLNTFEFTYKRGGSVIYLDEKIKELCYFFETNKEMFEERQGEDLRAVDAIQIYTVHQAKGLEWKYVFLGTVNFREFPLIREKETNFLTLSKYERPLYDVERYATKPEDEARLFFTAITRPMDGLVISYYKKNTEGDNKKSPFITRLEKDQEVNQYLKKLAPGDSILSFIPQNSQSQARNTVEFSEYAIDDILKYKSCPMAYKFNKVLNYPVRLNRLVGFGRALHNCLRRAVKLHANYFNNPNNEEFEQKIDEIVKDSFYLPYLDDSANKRFQKVGKEIIVGYASTSGGDLTQMESLEARLEFVNQNSILKGIADILMTTGDNSNESIHVRDYKTDKPDIENPNQTIAQYERERMEIYKLQVLLYAIALDLSGKRVTEASLGFLRDSENLLIDVSEEEKNKAMELAEKIIEKIKSRDYDPKLKERCEKRCDYSDICQYS